MQGREVLDSRGNPTVEVVVTLESGATGRAMVPSGASTGRHEAQELRDGGDRFHGRGVSQAVANVANEIAPALLGMDAGNQRLVDEELCKLDGTDNKRRLGANAILGVSLATAHAAAADSDQPLYRHLGGVSGYLLPLPFLNVLNGGAHADNNLDFQEFMLVPYGAASYGEALRWGVEVYHTLKALLVEQSLATSLGDEGGFAPNLAANKQALELLSVAIEKAGLRLGEDMGLALDLAASEFYEAGEAGEADGDSAASAGRYILRGDTADGQPRQLTPQEFIAELASLCNSFNIVSLEDPMDEDDWPGWVELTAELGQQVQLVGDDLFVTNVARLTQGIETQAANAILIKPNQIGTLSETLQAVQVASQHGFGTMMSHRSGETEDATIADLAVATNCGQIKAGAPARSDRTAKYNQLLRIEAELGAQARFWPLATGWPDCPAAAVAGPAAAATPNPDAAAAAAFTPAVAAGPATAANSYLGA